MHYEFRAAHTPDGELGVQVKNHLSSKLRAAQEEKRHKSQLADRPGFNEKRKITDGNFLRPLMKTEHKNTTFVVKTHDEPSRVAASV